MLACALASAAGATDLAASGVWTPSLRHTDLASGAGGALRGNIESAGGQVVLDISNSAGAAWTVTVRNEGAQWPAGVQMAVRVVSIGRGAGAASAGGAYLRLDGSAQVLVSGNGDRAGVQLQFKLDGTSVKNAVGNYSATVIYSLQ